MKISCWPCLAYQNVFSALGKVCFRCSREFFKVGLCDVVVFLDWPSGMDLAWAPSMPSGLRVTHPNGVWAKPRDLGVLSYLSGSWTYWFLESSYVKGHLI